MCVALLFSACTSDSLEPAISVPSLGKVELDPAATSIINYDDLMLKLGDEPDKSKNGSIPNCKCYIKISGVDNIGVGDLWNLSDISYGNLAPPLLEITGGASGWSDGIAPLAPFPSDYFLLPDTIPGSHLLGLAHWPVGNSLQGSITLHAFITCIDAIKGSTPNDPRGSLINSYPLEMIYTDGAYFLEDKLTSVFEYYFSCSEGGKPD